MRDNNLLLSFNSQCFFSEYLNFLFWIEYPNNCLNSIILNFKYVKILNAFSPWPFDMVQTFPFLVVIDFLLLLWFIAGYWCLKYGFLLVFLIGFLWWKKTTLPFAFIQNSKPRCSLWFVWPCCEVFILWLMAFWSLLQNSNWSERLCIEFVSHQVLVLLGFDKETISNTTMACLWGNSKFD